MKTEKDKVIRLLKTAKGQIEGVLKMIDDDRYCIDISNQVMATEAILRKVNRQILHDHLASCVTEAFEKGEQQIKIEEIMKIMDKLAK